MAELSQETLLRFANRWEPQASKSPQKYRMATCASCAKPMVKMWHCWLKEGGFKKEIHLCKRCYRAWSKI